MTSECSSICFSFFRLAIRMVLNWFEALQFEMAIMVNISDQVYSLNSFDNWISLENYYLTEYMVVIC